MKFLTVLMIRLCLGFIFFSSGLCKLNFGNFGQLIGPPDLIDSLAEYDLLVFGYMIAISQVLLGVFVMTQRFSVVGLIGMIPMNACILGFTVSQGWSGTPYLNATFLMLNVLALLYESDLIRYSLGYEVLRARSRSAQQFPSLYTPVAAIVFSVLAILVSSREPSIWVNVFATAAMLSIATTLFRSVSAFTTAERMLLSLYMGCTLLICIASAFTALLTYTMPIVLVCIILSGIVYTYCMIQRYRSH